MTLPAIHDASTSRHDRVPPDRREELMTPKQLGNHRRLARTIYEYFAQSLCSPKECEAPCRRRGRCAYFQPDPLPSGTPVYVIENLRHRNMPLRLATAMDDEAYGELCATVFTALD